MYIARPTRKDPPVVIRTCRGNEALLPFQCGAFATERFIIIGSPLFVLELLLPVVLFPIASFSLSFRQARPRPSPETPFSMEADLSYHFSTTKFERVPHSQTPANTPAVPNPAPISPMSPHPTWFKPSSNVTHASAVKPSFDASVPALLNPANIIL